MDAVRHAALQRAVEAAHEDRLHSAREEMSLSPSPSPSREREIPLPRERERETSREDFFGLLAHAHGPGTFATKRGARPFMCFIRGRGFPWRHEREGARDSPRGRPLRRRGPVGPRRSASPCTRRGTPPSPRQSRACPARPARRASESSRGYAQIADDGAPPPLARPRGFCPSLSREREREFVWDSLAGAISRRGMPSASASWNWSRTARLKARKVTQRRWESARDHTRERKKLAWSVPFFFFFFFLGYADERAVRRRPWPPPRCGRT